MRNTWNDRPDLSGNELLAWALCQIADSNHAIADSLVPLEYMGDDTSISGALDKLTAVLYDVGMVQGGIEAIGGLQYIADRVGGNLERIADQIEKETTTHDD